MKGTLKTMNPQQQQPVQVNPNAPYVFILSGAEFALAHEGLGELAAKRSQGLRDNLINQVQNQPGVFHDVQQIAAQRMEAAKSEATPPGETEPPAPTAPPASQGAVTIDGGLIEEIVEPPAKVTPLKGRTAKR